MTVTVATILLLTVAMAGGVGAAPAGAVKLKPDELVANNILWLFRRLLNLDDSVKLVDESDSIAQSEAHVKLIKLRATGRFRPGTVLPSVKGILENLKSVSDDGILDELERIHFGQDGSVREAQQFVADAIRQHGPITKVHYNAYIYKSADPSACVEFDIVGLEHGAAAAATPAPVVLKAGELRKIFKQSGLTFDGFGYC